jgi:hypothetical protein
VKGYSEHGNESSGSIKKGAEFLEKLLTPAEGLCFRHG